MPSRTNVDGHFPWSTGVITDRQAPGPAVFAEANLGGRLLGSERWCAPVAASRR
jgi:hypothetical protein